MAKMIKVIVKEAIQRADNGFYLDVSHTAFKKNPNEVYEIPDNEFWRKQISFGLITPITEIKHKEEQAEKRKVKNEAARNVKGKGGKNEKID